MLKNSIYRQLFANRSLNLLYRDIAGIARLDADFVSELLARKASGRGPTEAELDEAVDAVVRSLYSVNQYLDLDTTALKALRDLYRRTWERFSPGQAKAVHADHLEALGNIIARYYPQEFRTALAGIPEIGGVVNAEYDPRFQLQALGIETTALREPVLDIGCGPSAALVRHLRGLGIEAFGIDRLLDDETNFCYHSTWFDFDLKPETWGTVIANMSFSNHFIHALIYAPERSFAYLDRFQDILHSLIIRGSFFYAPSLPAEQELIDSRFYRTQHIFRTSGVSVTRVDRLS
jgi:hypothetical protein